MSGKIVADRYEVMKKGQSERLFQMLEEVLGDVGAKWAELDAIGVGIGPGNFTGIRIAVSAARGLSLSLDVPAIGVSRFDALYHLAGAPKGAVAVIVPGPRTLLIQRYKDSQDFGPTVECALSALDLSLLSEQWDGIIGEDDGSGNFHAMVYDFGAAGMLRAPDPIPVRHTERLVHATAEIAAGRLGTEVSAPAPLYIRPPDAAPSSDPPPVILA